MNLDLVQKITIGGDEYPFITFKSSEISEYYGLRDMFYGGGKFSDGGYLIQHPRETKKFYEARQKLAHYENVFGSELEATIDPIFAKDQNRSVSGIGSDIIDGYIANPTKRNESMSEFMKRLELDTSLYGATFLIAGGPVSTPEQGGRDGSQEFNPYTYYLTPTQITGYNFNDKGTLDLLVFPQSYTASEEIIYRVFMRYEDGSGLTFQMVDENVIEETVISMDEFPVLLCEDTSREVPEKIAKSRYLPMLSVAKKMYNLDSEIDDGYFKTCFSFLAINGQVPKGVDLSNASSFSYIGEKMNKPEYVTPPTEHLTVMEDKVTKLRTNMKEDLNSTVVISSQASGESRTAADKRRIEKMNLKASNLREIELWICNVALRNFVGGDYVYNVVYQTDFESLTKTDNIAALQSLIDSGVMDDIVKAEIAIDMIKITYSDDPTRRDYLIKIQEKLIKEMKSVPIEVEENTEEI